MRMEQRLTPQLIQSMAILQKPVTELEEFINDALETNAALEAVEPQGRVDSSGKADGNGRVRSEDSVGFERLARFSRDYDLEGADRAPNFVRRVRSDGDYDPKLAAMANTEERGENLQDHLLAQWMMLDLDPEVRRAGEVIINTLDPDGYLREPLDRLTTSVQPPVAPAALHAALPEVHKLEPRGVGARDVVECLLLQLEALPGDNSIERTLIERHLDDIGHNRLPHVARTSGYSLGEIQEAIQVMRTSLHLHPGYLVGDRTEPPIRPDVIVDYADTGNGLVVRLARGNLPELKIRDDVVALSRDRRGDKTAREFAKKHVEAAGAIIGALQFRNGRLLEVARAVVERQREFFDIGPAGLKVFRMGELAEQFGCDASTISRTVADKYMQTPRGMFPMRYFFTGGAEMDTGEVMGWDRVKERVRELIEQEDRKDPLSDEQLTDVLRQEGLDLSRRTIAKYRQQLGIPTARQRRVF